jgi:hypothetical protein
LPSKFKIKKMKKVLFFGVVALLGLSSCKKNYTCECIQTIDLMGQKTNQTITTPIKDTKANATDACKALSLSTNTSSSYGGTVTMNCNLK